MKTAPFLMLLFMLFLACKKEQKTIAETPETTIPATSVKEFSYQQVYKDTLTTESALLKHFDERKNYAESLLKQATPENADEIYENYRKENDSALALLERLKNQLLSDYFNYHDYDEQGKIINLKLPDSVKTTVAEIEKRNIEFWDIGEGMTDLRMKPDFYRQMFQGKLSPDYQKYLDFTNEEDKVLFAADAGIIIPWRKVAERIEVREDFLKKFPISALTNTVESELNSYRYAYLLGYDNTPTGQGKSFYSEILAEFNRFMQTHPKSQTTAILKKMLAVPYNSEKIRILVQKETHFGE